VSCKLERGERRISVRQEDTKSCVYKRCVLADKTGLSGAMSDQYMLHAIYALDFGGFWIYPVYHLLYSSGSEDLLMLDAQVATQIDAPVLVMFAPPIKVNVETRL